MLLEPTYPTLPYPTLPYPTLAHHQLRHSHAHVFYPSPLVSIHYVNEVPRCSEGAIPCRRPPAR